MAISYETHHGREKKKALKTAKLKEDDEKDAEARAEGEPEGEAAEAMTFEGMMSELADMIRRHCEAVAAGNEEAMEPLEGAKDLANEVINEFADACSSGEEWDSAPAMEELNKLKESGEMGGAMSDENEPEEELEPEGEEMDLEVA